MNLWLKTQLFFLGYSKKITVLCVINTKSVKWFSLQLFPIKKRNTSQAKQNMCNALRCKWHQSELLTLVVHSYFKLGRTSKLLWMLQPKADYLNDNTRTHPRNKLNFVILIENKRANCDLGERKQTISTSYLQFISSWTDLINSFECPWEVSNTFRLSSDQGEENAAE